MRSLLLYQLVYTLEVRQSMPKIDTFESLTFYRGMSEKHPIDRPSIVNVPKNRLPKHTSIAIHKVADAWFKNRFNIAYRSNALFLTSNFNTALQYAHQRERLHVFRIIPLYEYRYCWSPLVSDMLSLTGDLSDLQAGDIVPRLGKSFYCQDRLEEAHSSGHEVMLHCEQCVAIPIHLLEEH